MLKSGQNLDLIGTRRVWYGEEESSVDLLFCQETGGSMCGCRNGARAEGIILVSDYGYFLSTGDIDDIHGWCSSSGRRVAGIARFCPKGDKQLTADDIKKAVHYYYSCHHSFAKDEWIVLFEAYISTGEFSTLKNKPFTVDPLEYSRSIDVLTINMRPFKQYRIIAHEIKTSRNDFLHELKHPEKRELALKYSNQFFFVTPPHLVKPSEIPTGCGLMEVTEAQFFETKYLTLARIKNSAISPAAPLPMSLMVHLLSKAYRSKGAIKCL